MFKKISPARPRALQASRWKSGTRSDSALLRRLLLLKGTLLLFTGVGLEAQTEQQVIGMLEGEKVVARIDMPAAAKGVDLDPDRTPSIDHDQNSRLLRQYGTAIAEGTEVRITKIVVNRKSVEIHLDGGGYRWIASGIGKQFEVDECNELQSVQQEVRDLSRDLNKTGLSDTQRERLSALYLEKQNDQRRLQTECSERTKEVQREEAKTYGSRITINYGSNVMASGLEPSMLVAALEGVVEFAPTVAQVEPEPPPEEPSVGTRPPEATIRGARPSALPPDLRKKAGFDREQSVGLFIGVSEFRDESLLEIPYAVDDAVDLAHLFTIELELISPQKTALALAGEPRKPETRERLSELEAAGATIKPALQFDLYDLLEKQPLAAGPQGIYVVTLATHGFAHEGSQYLAANNSRQARIAKTGIGASEVFDQVGRAKTGRRVVLIDACRERLETGRAGGADPRTAMGEAFADAMSEASGQVILSGTTLGGYTYDDPERQNGVFTGAILDGLRGEAPADERSLITVEKLASFVDERVRSWVEGNRPLQFNDNTGIEASFGGQASGLPLAVDPVGLGAAEDFRARCDAAVAVLQQNLGVADSPIDGIVFEQVRELLSVESPTPETLGLLSAVEELDGSLTSHRALAYYLDNMGADPP